jgi:transcriptional regulator with XRE-family HTH domain
MNSHVVKGAEVRRVRTRLGLTQREFAERVGVIPNTVARWERDEAAIGSTAAILIRLLAQLHRKEARR